MRSLLFISKCHETQRRLFHRSIRIGEKKLMISLYHQLLLCCPVTLINKVKVNPIAAWSSYIVYHMMLNVTKFIHIPYYVDIFTRRINEDEGFIVITLHNWYARIFSFLIINYQKLTLLKENSCYELELKWI